jgi:hypothetical protein
MPQMDINVCKETRRSISGDELARMQRGLQ